MEWKPKTNDGRIGRANDFDSYQIDCQTTKKGKLIAGTKRRICWKFGFSNRDAVQRGLSGSDCRGEEHEVVFVWSLTSGKKFVLADGHEVHWSKQSPFSEKFDGPWKCSWTSNMAGKSRELAVVANASTTLFEKKSGKKSAVDNSFRNFNLLIDGVNYLDMPQMFELGLSKSVEDQHRIRMGGLGSQGRNVEPQPRRRKQIHNIALEATSQHSIQPDRLFFPEQQNQQQRQQLQGSLTLKSGLLSQSMPDMRHVFSASQGGRQSVCDTNHNLAHDHQMLQQPISISPTSVRDFAATNAFVCADTSFKPIQQKHHYLQHNQHQPQYQYQPQQYQPQQQQQLTHAPFNNNYFPHPQQYY